MPKPFQHFLPCGCMAYHKSSSGETLTADDGGKEETFALIGRLDDADFAAKLAAFVKEILRIKAAAKA